MKITTPMLAARINRHNKLIARLNENPSALFSWVALATPAEHLASRKNLIAKYERTINAAQNAMSNRRQLAQDNLGNFFITRARI